MLPKKIRKIINIILVLTILLLIGLFIIPRPITPAGSLDNIILGYEKKYNDISKYTLKCNHGEIMLVAYYYKRKINYNKCEEWIIKRNKCVSLYPDYNKSKILNPTKECK